VSFISFLPLYADMSLRLNRTETSCGLLFIYATDLACAAAGHLEVAVPITFGIAAYGVCDMHYRDATGKGVSERIYEGLRGKKDKSNVCRA